MLKRYRHFSFDLDGTLVHTKPEYRHTVIPRVVELLNGRVPDDRASDAFWFEGRRDEIIRQDFNLDPAAFWPVLHQHDSAEFRNPHTFAYPDVEPTLRQLHTDGMNLSIVTGAPTGIATMEISKLNGIPLDFIFSITSNRYLSKPDPTSLHFVLEQLKIGPDETVYVGNSTEDAQFAKNAGVDFIYLERREHEFHGRDTAIATIHSLAELLG